MTTPAASNQPDACQPQPLNESYLAAAFIALGLPHLALSDARRRELLGRTNLGQKVLAAQGDRPLPAVSSPRKNYS
jgi:hypothetical protein